MAYDVSDQTLWQDPDELVLYRTLPADAAYPPDEPYNSVEGRFSDGRRLLLYLAQTPSGAVAEYLRWHPELIEMQEALLIVVFEVHISLTSRSLDVRTQSQTEKIPFPFERLTSSENGVTVRYKECRELARDVDAVLGGGIAHPSAAFLQQGACNTTLLGQNGGRWFSGECITVERPHLDTTLIRRHQKSMVGY